MNGRIVDAVVARALPLVACVRASTVPAAAIAAPRIGCSGWIYTSWRGAYYPAGVPTSRWLAHYARDFDCVEANGTFYRLPEAETFARWAVETPDGFVMAVKASRYLTHMKKLRDPGPPLQRLFERASALGPRLGPVLYQLPPQMPRDDARLDGFLDALPHEVAVGAARRPVQHVIEFRHPSWYADATFARLAARGVAWCLHDKAGSALDAPVDGPIVYVRFHGTSGHYHGAYGRAALSRWARRLAAAAGSGRPVFAFFNNDPDAVATTNAHQLRDAVRRALAATGEAAGGSRRGRHRG